jgi:hypothetical protein
MALVFVNTLMIQDMPLFWMHLQLYGEVRLNTGSRLKLAAPEPEPARHKHPRSHWRVTWHLVGRSLTPPQPGAARFIGSRS